MLTTFANGANPFAPEPRPEPKKRKSGTPRTVTQARKLLPTVIEVIPEVSRRTNRFTANQVWQFIGKDKSRTAVARGLSMLAKEGKLSQKVSQTGAFYYEVRT